MSGTTLIAAAILAGLLAQSPTPPTGVVERLSLDIVFADGRVTHHPVGARRSGAWTPMFPRLPGWTTPNGALPLAAIKLGFERTDEGVRFAIGVMLGKSHEREEVVHEGTLRPGESARVDGLAKYGAEPIEVRLEPLPEAEFYEPTIANVSSGLVVTAVSVTSNPSPRYHVTVENITGLDVRTFSVEFRKGGRPALSGVKQRDDGQPIVAPGRTYTFDSPFPTGPTALNQPWAPQPADQIAITSVTWADGSFDGPLRPTAVFKVRELAQVIQLDRLLPLLAQAASNPVADRTTLPSLRRAIDALPILPEVAIGAADALIPTAAGIAPGERADIIRFTLQRTKARALDDLAALETSVTTNSAASVGAGLADIERRYREWRAQLGR